jgi:hypothetical protein
MQHQQASLGALSSAIEHFVKITENASPWVVSLL